MFGFKSITKIGENQWLVSDGIDWSDAFETWSAFCILLNMVMLIFEFFFALNLVNKIAILLGLD